MKFCQNVAELSDKILTMQRRKFLKYILAGAAVSFTGIAVLPGFDLVLKNMVEKDTKKLKIQSGAIDTFLKDAQEQNSWGIFSPAKKQFIRAHYLLSNPLFKLPYHNKYTEYRSQVTGKFLLSTSFFRNKMNEKETVVYLALYDPYARPCGHPFSNLYYS